VLLAGAAGFLVFNFPPARIFMGDVGSAFLGFTFATLAVIGASLDLGHLSFYIVPLLLFHFIFDTAFTFLRRLSRGEKVHLAHRTHLYQLLNGLGYSHRAVSLFHYGLTTSRASRPSRRSGCRLKCALVFIPFLIFETPTRAGSSVVPRPKGFSEATAAKRSAVREDRNQED
jgi:UDP-GlcNAc:undecaprenyl-phosphate GlcNAc-1-phosphate transferase